MSESATADAETEAGRISARELAKRGALAVGASLLANWLLLGAVLAGNVVEPFDPLSFPPVTFLTAVGAVGATLVYGGLTRLVSNPDRVFLLVAAVVLVLSFVPDVALLEVDPGATVPGVVVLMAMHVTVAVICVASLTDRYSPLSG